MDIFFYFLIIFFKKKESFFNWMFISLICSLMSFNWLGIPVSFLSKINIILIVLVSFIFYLGYICVQNMNLFLNMICFSSLMFFISLNFFFLFLFFELSLIPILLIIFLWGIQPERLSAFYFLLLYTIFSSFPLFISILFLPLQNMFIFWSINLISLFCFSFSFLVKLPMFLFHIWLPKAHVEAPTLGSIILAGLLLKLGGFGICFILKTFINLFNFFFLFVSILGSVLACFICCFQSDGKSLVAFSSVCHLNFLLFTLIFLYSSSKTFSIFCLLIHGLNSSFMFWIVGTISHWTFSRNIIWINNLLIFSLPILMMSALIFFSNFGVPPMISFFQEIMFFSCIMFFSWILFFFNVFYLMLTCYFSLYLFLSFFSFKNFFSKQMSFCNIEIFSLFIFLLLINFFLFWLI